MEHEDGFDGDDIGTTGGLAGTVVEVWWVALLVVVLVGIVLFVGFQPGGSDRNDVRTDAPATTTTTTTTAPAPTTTEEPAVEPTAPETTVATTTEVPATTTTSTAPVPSTSTSTSTTTPPEPGRAIAALIDCRASGSGTAAVVRITQTGGEPSRFSVTVSYVGPAGNTIAKATTTSAGIAPGSSIDLTVQIPSGGAQGGCLVTGGPAPV